MFLTDFLQQYGFDVWSAANGHEALSILQTGTVDVLFIDYDMPDMTGLEVVREVRRLHPQVPIALVSGMLATLPAEAIDRAGVDRVFSKPFNLPELSQWLATL